METIPVRIRALLPDSLSRRIVDECTRAQAAFGFDDSLLRVPLPITLKEPYRIDDYDFSLRALRDFFAGHGGFAAMTGQLAVLDGMLWLEASPEPSLSRVHRNIDTILHSRFDVPEAAYDRDFRPHITLFRNEDEESLRTVARRLEGCFDRELFGVERILVESPDRPDAVIELA